MMPFEFISWHLFKFRHNQVMISVTSYIWQLTAHWIYINCYRSVLRPSKCKVVSRGHYQQVWSMCV